MSKTPESEQSVDCKTFTEHTDGVSSVSFSPDGSRIVSGSWDETVRVLDVKSGKCVLGPLEEHTESVNSVSFSPDGKRIVSGSGDWTLECYDMIPVRVWDASSGECILPREDALGNKNLGNKNLENRNLGDKKSVKKSVESVSFSPDGSKIVSGSDDGTVQVWDASSGELLKTLDGHTGDVKSVSFSPDGSKIVSGSFDTWVGTVYMWDSTTGEELMKQETPGVYSVSFSPDGSKIVSGSRDKTVRVWDLSSGGLLKLEGHTGDVSSVSFSPNGLCIVSGSHDKTVCVWDVKSGKCVLGPLKEHTGYVSSVAFSPDGSKIVSGSWDNTVRVWDVSVLNQWYSLVSWLTAWGFNKRMPDALRIQNLHFNAEFLTKLEAQANRIGFTIDNRLHNFLLAWCTSDIASKKKPPNKNPLFRF